MIRRAPPVCFVLASMMFFFLFATFQIVCGGSCLALLILTIVALYTTYESCFTNESTDKSGQYGWYAGLAVAISLFV